jgi:hypothetical protein
VNRFCVLFCCVVLSLAANDAACAGTSGVKRSPEAGTHEEGGAVGVTPDASADASISVGCFCIDGSLVPASCEAGMGWHCAVAEGCGSDSSTPTTLTGKVFDPAGLNPVYGAWVFVPSVAAGPTFLPGTHGCDLCTSPIGDYVAAGVTDASGSFVLTGVPTGSDVPVTVQIGKWTRTVSISIAQSCAENTVPEGILRLPRNGKEGTLPRMALLTGGGDDLGCFLRRIGVDASEFTGPRGAQAVNVYQGVSASNGAVIGYGPALSGGVPGDCTGSSCPLWASKSSLESFDLVLLACEGDPYLASKPPAAIQAMHDWLMEGGKLFAAHSQALWFQQGPSDFQGVAQWTPFSPLLSSGSYALDTGFPKGLAFEQWLTALDDGGVTKTVVFNGVSESVGSVSAAAFPWISHREDVDGSASSVGDASMANVKYLSFGVPVATSPQVDGSTTATGSCGKAAFSDIHARTSPEGDVPDSCDTGPLSPEELAMEFLFFDLSACVGDDFQPPPGPPSP